MFKDQRGIFRTGKGPFLLYREIPISFSGKAPCGFMEKAYLCSVNL